MLPSPQSVRANGMNQTVSSLSKAGAVISLIILQLIEGWENPRSWHEASQDSGCKCGGPSVTKELWSSAGGTPCWWKAWKSVTRGITWEWLKLGCQALANLFGVWGADKQEVIPSLVPCPYTSPTPRNTPFQLPSPQPLAICGSLTHPGPL